MPTPKIRPRPSSPPAPIAAAMDLSLPAERAAHDLLRRFTTGRWPQWRLLGLRRDDGLLLAAVEWVRSHAPARFAVAELSLREETVRWRDYFSATAARQALAESSAWQQRPAQQAPKSRSAA